MHICLLPYVQFVAPDDGRKERLKHAECFTRINNLRKRCILLVVLQEEITYFKFDIVFGTVMAVVVVMIPTII